MQEPIQGFQLSPQQKRLWLLQQDNNSYYAQSAILLEGDLKIEVLKSALTQIISRHEILRTTFHHLQGFRIPIQVIGETSDVRFSKCIMQTSLEQKCTNRECFEQELEILFETERQLNFDWEKGPLLQAKLVTLLPNQYLLLISLPSLCADMVSLNNLVQELSCSYAACLQGEELSDKPLQYVDFSEWQNQSLVAEDMEPGRKYWRQQNISGLETLKLIGENQSLDKLEFKPRFLTLPIQADLVETIEVIAQNYETSPSVFFLSCWQILLWHLIGDINLIVGVGCDGRDYEEITKALGLFTKYLPLSYHLNNEHLFSQHLCQIHQLVSNIFEWQESFTWDSIVGTDKLEIDFPFLPFCFDFEKYPTPYSIENVTFSIHKLYSCIDKFKLKLLCVEQDNCLNLEFHYDSNLLCREDINCIARQFHTLLVNALNSPDVAIAELKILGDAEKQQLLVEFNNTKTSDFSNKCIHQLIEEQVEKTPDAIAVVFEPEQLTYRELNARANQLAHYLQTLGVGPEVHVGICAERSVEMLVGLLGILKAGGVYIPLDPAYPQQRLALMLNDAPVPVVLTQQRLVETLANHSAQLVCLDSDWAAITTHSTQNFTTEVSIENLAYTIYTSGSTGTPKGVMISHQALCNHMLWMRTTWPLTTADKVLHKTSISFDASGWELYAPLIAGAQLVMAQPQGHKDSVYLVEAITQHEITILQLVPSMLQMLLTQPTLEKCRCLRSVYCGGEPLPLELYKSFASRLDAQLYNLYGPTETCIDVTSWTCESKSQRWTVPIGRPIANTQLYVLDQQGLLAPIGIAGELYIGGVGLARGYLNQFELTAQKFIPNPYSNKPGERLYKTGDLVCYQPDGTLKYLGRLDNQVKIRGYRIELGEIEIILSQHPGIREVVVLARENLHGEKRLVAYLVANQQPAPSIDELRHFLKEKLPEYMMPSSFLVLKTLPLTPNGKVDHHALSKLDTDRPELSSTYVAPRTDVEKVLADIWSDVLGLKRIGVYDNFFQLGGDSILSIQVIARANQSGLALTTKQLFQHQTIAELASVAGTRQIFQAEQGLVTGEIPLTPIQRWFFEQELKEAHHWNQAILLSVQQSLNLALVKQTVQQLLVHHDALRLRFARLSFDWQQINILPDSSPPFTQVDLSTLSVIEQTQVMEEFASLVQSSLNLESGPLMRVALFNLGKDQPYRLLFIVHHLAVDGVSWRILLEDLQVIYQQLHNGQAIKLPYKTTSFRDWAISLNEYAQKAALESELDYWLTLDQSSVTPLPIDYPEGKSINTVANTSQVSVALTPEDTRTLLQEVPQAYNTQINDVLLTALVQTFAQWTGEHSLLVDMEGHGRENILETVDLSRTVGWFTTIFPVLLDLQQVTAPGEALKLMKEQLRRIPNQGISYGILRYLKGAEITKQLQALPQAEISFNYLGQFDQVLSSDNVFQLAQEFSGPTRSPKNSRKYLLEVNAAVIGGCLQLDWIYSKAVYRKVTIDNLAQSFVTALQTLITHCKSSETGGYTPSDFPMMGFSQKELDEIIAELS
ncbi:hypothetical protein BZZ01_09835 [Nostocales cyanobacterium HT-58-2]|nr:hypothetical protein BZZ01_09835 [Nostocales cyanobacterium HT-58-2]